MYSNHTLSHYALLVGIDLLPLVTSAQVYTHVYPSNDELARVMPWYFSEAPAALDLPLPDITAILAQDSTNRDGIKRIAAKREVDYFTDDGTFYDFGNYTVWKIAVQSRKAKSLGFYMPEVNLPPGSALYIYSTESSTVIGPVRQEQLSDGAFMSDVLPGSSGTIEVVLPLELKDEFYLTISAYYYGLVHPIKPRDNRAMMPKAYGDALTCIPDVACADAQAWQMEADAVCMTIVDGEGSCTGTLITDDCHTNTPYILTARHCTINQNLSRMAFRFKYQNINCGSVDEPSAFSWVTFTGATLEASWEDADFSLLELTQTVLPNHGLTFAGWDRSSTVPTEVNILHHPQGDAMKYAFENGLKTIGQTDQIVGGSVPYTLRSGDYIEFDFTPGSNADIGTVEPGSSGSSLFDINHRVVGIISGGIPGTCSDVTEALAGRFSSAWDGGGTSSTRLRDWLGSTVAFGSTNSYTIPQVNGPEIVCTGDTYTVNNLPGWTASWTVTPAHLFSGPTTGNGDMATLSRSGYTASGEATLTFTLQSPFCGQRTVTKTLWVGRPAIPDVSTPQCFEQGLNYFLSASADGATSYSWGLPSCPYLPSDPERCWQNYSGARQNVYVHTGEQGGSVSVFASNRCGTRSVNVPVEFCDLGGGGGGGIIPRKGGGEITAVLKEALFVTPNIIHRSATNTATIRIRRNGGLPVSGQLIDMNGRVVRQLAIERDRAKVDCSSLSGGLHIVRITDGQRVWTEKLLIQ